MPDDNRFAGLSEGLDAEEEGGMQDSEVAEADPDEADVGEPSATSPGPADSSPPTPTDVSADTVVSESKDDEGGPAFSFDDTTAKSIYVREDTLAVLEDTEFEVEMRLRRDHSIRDVTGREFHDAAVHVIEEHVDEVVEAVLAARDE